MRTLAMRDREEQHRSHDLLVVRRDRIVRRGLESRPELAIAILSPASKGVDRLLKYDRYERAGTPAYWIADPDALTPRAFELRGGRYVESAFVGGDDTWIASTPYEARITPSKWLA